MHATLSEDEIGKILRGINIPAQPQIMADLQMAQAYDPVDFDEIINLISRDVSICGNVIKVANSPFYGLNRSITDLQQAIMLLGLETVLNTVNCVAMRQSIVDMSKLSDADISFLNRFWDCAEDTAKVCSLISKQLQLDNPHSLYLIGLFNNAGIPLMVQGFSNYRDVLAEAYTLCDATITDTEDRYFKTNHAVLSYYLARSWKMPQFICDAIAEHHNMKRLLASRSRSGDELLNKLCILKLAEHLVGLYSSLGRHELDLEWEQIGGDVLDYLSLTHDEAEDLQHLCNDLGIG